MRVAVVYCYPLVRARNYFPLAKRFAETYREFPGDYPHDLILGTNGGRPGAAHLAPFSAPGMNYQILDHDNSGWDIGLYFKAARVLSPDLLVCLGSPAHCYRRGWLRRMVDAYVENGPHFYGCWGYRRPRWHIRTTIFWLPPQLLLSYPHPVTSLQRSRYAFEHGAESLTRWVQQAGFRSLVVSWDQVWDESGCESARMDVGDCLLLDQHTHL